MTLVLINGGLVGWFIANLVLQHWFNSEFEKASQVNIPPLNLNEYLPPQEVCISNHAYLIVESRGSTDFALVPKFHYKTHLPISCN